ncbi:proteasome subunit alpha-1 [Acrasis kona]|uniref:Proteasome subunit alpha type n=1 Tax=Acrasis kona TaxID=1008807 RepID=A0AAW2Z4E3_9EUKA
MFRNQYDTDITTWSPAGRLHQVEYAMEAVKQGSACVGLKSNTLVVIGSLKRSPHAELSSYQKKLAKIDDHIGFGIAGLASDGRVLIKNARTQAINHKYTYDTPISVQRLVLQISDKSQVSTQRSSKRPYGVGLLISGYDEQTGTHLFQTEPSGNYYEYKAIAIGARSQSARTYFEKNYQTFEEADEETLILHALRALKGTTGDNVELTSKNASISIVGKDRKYKLIEEEQLEPYLAKLEENAAATTEQQPAEQQDDVDEEMVQ